LAAEGTSNAEIAQSLSVTVKTVEMHLTHAYRKLGIKGRAELPAIQLESRTTRSRTQLAGRRPAQDLHDARTVDCTPMLPAHAALSARHTSDEHEARAGRAGDCCLARLRYSCAREIVR